MILIEENKPLATCTTFGIGGPARWFTEVSSETEIVEASTWAADRGVPVFVLGGGSNLLVSDAGFGGLVLQVALRGIEVSPTLALPGASIYRAAAGEDWDGLVERTVQEGCAGLECLAGIPGSVGGTPVQNVGAYGQEVASTIERVRAFDLEQRLFVEFSASECEFQYRRSRFNARDRGRYLVTRVDYRLKPGGKPTVEYRELQNALAAKVGEGRQESLAEVASIVRSLRQAKGMLMVEGDPDCCSAGSFFKNPVVNEAGLARIREASGKQPPSFPVAPDASAPTGSSTLYKIPAAWMIEQAGFQKGYALGRAGISSRHTLALVNLGGATADEVLTLANQIREAVHRRFGLQLEMEPVRLGF